MARRLCTVVSASAVAEQLWDDLCRRWGWFWHGTGWRRYTVAYAGDRPCRDVSFALLREGELVAAVPLYVTVIDGEARGAGPDGPCWAPVVAGDLPLDDRASILGQALDEAAHCCAEHGAASLDVQLSPLVAAFPDVAVDFTALTALRGYADHSIATSVVDLREPEAARWARMSESHRRSVKRGLASLDVHVDASPSAFAAYRDLHFRAAGRQTRPEETFALMAGWLTSGDALLLTAHEDGVPVGAVLVLVFGEGAYYASGANDVETAARLPVAHVLHWAAMRELARRGVASYEVGIVQEVPVSGAGTFSNKEQGIATFKRRFGGLTRPLVRRRVAIA